MLVSGIKLKVHSSDALYIYICVCVGVYICVYEITPLVDVVTCHTGDDMNAWCEGKYFNLAALHSPQRKFSMQGYQ